MKWNLPLVLALLVVVAVGAGATVVALSPPVASFAADSIVETPAEERGAATEQERLPSGESDSGRREFVTGFLWGVGLTTLFAVAPPRFRRRSW